MGFSVCICTVILRFRLNHISSQMVSSKLNDDLYENCDARSHKGLIELETIIDKNNVILISVKSTHSKYIIRILHEHQTKTMYNPSFYPRLFVVVVAGYTSFLEVSLYLKHDFKRLPYNSLALLLINNTS